MKIIDLLRNSAKRHPDAVVVTGDDLMMTYSCLDQSVDQLAKILRDNGCAPGVKVAIVLNKSVEYLISFFAISAAKGIIVPLSASMTAHEISGFIEKADISIVITSRRNTRKFSDSLEDEITLIIADCDQSNALKIDVPYKNCVKTDAENSDVALMAFTSGSTGKAKATMLRDDQLITNMIAYRSVMGFTEHNVVYCAIPLHHIYCITAQILTHISLGDTFVMSGNIFFIKDFFKSVEKYKVTISAFVPSMAMLMTESPQSSQFCLRTLRYITMSGAKTPANLYRQLCKKFKDVKFVNTYGMTEAGSRISIAAPNTEDYPVESVGKPMPNIMVRIVSENADVVDVNEVGEVEVKSSGVMKGYYNQPELTLQTVVNGWLKTGDLGRLDEDGNLFLVGRKKELIISGGENIYPPEVEQCLLSHPAIIEAAVIGKYHKRLQEVPYAFVVRKKHIEIDAPELIRFCRKHLSTQKIPAEFHFLDQMPKVGTSKVDRLKLKRTLESIGEGKL